MLHLSSTLLINRRNLFRDLHFRFTGQSERLCFLRSVDANFLPWKSVVSSKAPFLSSPVSVLSCQFAKISLWSLRQAFLSLHRFLGLTAIYRDRVEAELDPSVADLMPTKFQPPGGSEVVAPSPSRVVTVRLQVKSQLFFLTQMKFALQRTMLISPQDAVTAAAVYNACEISLTSILLGSHPPLPLELLQRFSVSLRVLAG